MELPLDQDKRLTLEALDFFRAKVEKQESSTVSAVGKYLPLTQEQSKETFDYAPADAGYRMRDIPDLRGGTYKGMLIAKPDEIEVRFSKGYQFNEELLTADKCCHAQQGEKSFEAARDGDAVHKETATMCINAPTQADRRE